MRNVLDCINMNHKDSLLEYVEVEAEKLAEDIKNSKRALNARKRLRNNLALDLKNAKKAISSLQRATVSTKPAYAAYNEWRAEYNKNEDIINTIDGMIKDLYIQESIIKVATGALLCQ